MDKYIYIVNKTVAIAMDAKYNDDGETVYQLIDINIYVGNDAKKAKKFKLSQFDEEEDVQYLAIEVWKNEKHIESMDLIQEKDGVWEKMDEEYLDFFDDEE